MRSYQLAIRIEERRIARHSLVQQIDGLLKARQWLSDQYSVLDPYALTFYAWGLRRELPVAELTHYRAFKDRMLARAAVARALDDEKVKV